MDLAAYQAERPFLVGIDSDGCVFDSMELKHKECFIPQFINHYGLQGISKYAREAAEFVNLYSKSRGVNRFPGLVEQLDRLRRRPEVAARGAHVPSPDGLRRWIEAEAKLGNPALEQAVAATGDPDLKLALEWSLAVNRAIAAMVRDVPPFPFVRESLERLSGKADMLVVSATPNEALAAEWREHDLAKYVRHIYGQEHGAKKEVLRVAKHYAADRTLMIGDAPGDYKAAVANDALFFPINPGHEEASWRRLHDEGIERFLSGSFAGGYQQLLLEEFNRLLPEHPPWKVN
jgi:phosphoglycolate phosphatase-like HAD superfamily hydrolase